jgi:hypothetical protein
MIRKSILFSAFVIAFGLAGTSLAMASGSNAKNATHDHDKAKAAQTTNSCDTAPRYEEPAYCGPNHGH